ncbi:50S ribosomal protein L19 [Patescibacteria group bacterium]|nr:50S ribosomal protein L19 [Patescibacteria group bacterium]
MTVNIEERKNWDLKSGNTVKVWQKVKEKEKIRLQVFEGLIISHKHGFEPGATFTVRKIAEGVGVERIFPVFSPNIEKIEITKRAKTRRAKLYYVREKAAKQIRKKMKEARISKVQEEKIEETAEPQEKEQQSEE